MLFWPVYQFTFKQCWYILVSVPTLVNPSFLTQLDVLPLIPMKRFNLNNINNETPFRNIFLQVTNILKLDIIISLSGTLKFCSNCYKGMKFVLWGPFWIRKLFRPAAKHLFKILFSKKSCQFSLKNCIFPNNKDIDLSFLDSREQFHILFKSTGKIKIFES